MGRAVRRVVRRWRHGREGGDGPTPALWYLNLGGQQGWETVAHPMELLGFAPLLRRHFHMLNWNHLPCGSWQVWGPALTSVQGPSLLLCTYVVSGFSGFLPLP